MVEDAPVPGANLLAKLTGWAMGKIVANGLNKMLPGDYTLINVLIELSKGAIHLDHFEDPNFYLSIEEKEKRKVNKDLRKLDAISDDKDMKNKVNFLCGLCSRKSKKKFQESTVSQIPKDSEFSLSKVNKYVTARIDFHKRDIYPNSNTENNDFCLESLFQIKGEYKFL